MWLDYKLRRRLGKWFLAQIHREGAKNAPRTKSAEDKKEEIGRGYTQINAEVKGKRKERTKEIYTFS